MVDMVGLKEQREGSMWGKAGGGGWFETPEKAGSSGSYVR